MQYANLPIVRFLLYPLCLFLLHLFSESASGVLVFGLGLWVGQPQLVGYTVCLLLCPFLRRTRLIYWVLFS